MASRISANDAPPLPSERNFGLLFVLVFLLASGYTLYKGLPLVLAASLGCAGAVVLVVSFLAPRWLAPFNRAWFALGLLLGKIVSPVVLGAIFFLLITPISLSMRLMGRDALKLRTRDVNTRWVDRNPAGPDPGSFKNQF